MLASEEEKIIAALHFILSFGELSEETGFPGQVLEKHLARLINDGLVLAMEWNEEMKDFVAAGQTRAFDRCFFMATKDGLKAYYYSA